MTKNRSDIMKAAHKRARAWVRLNGKEYRKALSSCLKSAWQASKAWTVTADGPKPSAFFLEYFSASEVITEDQIADQPCEVEDIDFAML